MTKRKPPELHKPKGRTSIKTPELLTTICDRIAAGENLSDITAEPDMPDQRQVSRWLLDDHAFARQYARAREDQADHMDALILRTALASKQETANADRVKIMAYQWRASRLKPRVYGDKQMLDVTVRYADLTDEELDAEIARKQRTLGISS